MKKTAGKSGYVASIALTILLQGCASRSRDVANDAAPPSNQEVGTLMAAAEKSAAAGDYGQAIAIYQRAVKVEPERGDIWFLLGGAHLRNQQPEMAQRVLEQALRVDPKLSKSYANLALAHLAQFRDAASRAVVSDQVSDSNRTALRSLLRDVDQALFPATELPKPEAKP